MIGIGTTLVWIRTPAVGVALAVGLVMAPSRVAAEEIGGVEFPAGDQSFADKMIRYEPEYAGGPGPTGPFTFDPVEALGRPNYETNHHTGTVSLGHGGRITLEFTNNFLTGNGTAAPDLYIFEVGPDVEDTYIEVSENGISWHALGKVDGSLAEIDLDAFGYGDHSRFRYIRLRDDPNEGSPDGMSVGADIDAVGAISAMDRPEWIEANVTRLATGDTSKSAMQAIAAKQGPWLDLSRIAPVPSHSDPGRDAESGVLIGWDTVEDRLYLIQWTDDLTAGTWYNLGEPLIGDGLFVEVYDPDPRASHRIYRVLVP